MIKLNFFHDTDFEHSILFVLGEKYWKERSAGRVFSTMGMWLQEWYDAEERMEVEKLILFNQRAGKGRHLKWAHWWLLSWSLMYPLPSAHIYIFRLCTHKKRECDILTGNYTANNLAVVFIQRKYTHIGTSTKNAVSLGPLLGLCDRYPEVANLHTAAAADCCSTTVDAVGSAGSSALEPCLASPPLGFEPCRLTAMWQLLEANQNKGSSWGELMMQLGQRLSISSNEMLT